MRAALTARIAIGTAAGAIAAALLGAWVTDATVDGAAGTAVRTVLVLVVLVLVPWWALRQELLQAHRARLRTWAVAGVLVGYLVNPFAWRGDALVAGAFTPLPAAWVVDLALWMAVGAASCVVTSHAAARSNQSLGYTG
ncbi:hypothetical protein HP550_12890 [Cellulomonas humilata]|uniref:Uncharacterized protein n=1 Tax=Cellulomonas humilata TaxID=144055 RepID=A0A7Y6A1P0_9CELL|nr:hypothetical protein [Cellulomonas humilata]NUU18146.1 hypothetical protein [Cellulomonas humilata]